MLLTASREGGMGKVELFHSDGEEVGEGGEQQRGERSKLAGSSRTVSGSSQDSGTLPSLEGEESSSQDELQARLQEQVVEEQFQPELFQIREVWRHNLREEMQVICHMVQTYPLVAMDTEFPGVVANPTGNYDTEEYRYQQVKCNVDLLKLIQLGITLFDGAGRMPDGVCTWQFNFEFDLETDMFAEESISLLQNSGLEFDKHQKYGIRSQDFAELMYSSGLVLMDNVTWLTFHSAYDFGYLLSQLTNDKLPATEAEFKADIKIFFPNIYDIKYLMLFTDNLIGGLQSVANYLQVERIGMQHQAGSDSLLTGQVFFRIYEEYFSEGLDDVKYCGQIAGFKNSYPSNVKRELEDSLLCAELEELHPGMASPMRDH